MASRSARCVAVSPSKHLMSIAISVADVETALNTRLATFTNPQVRSSIVRATSTYSVPAALAKDVSMVGELHQFPRPRVLKYADSATMSSTASWPNTCTSSSCANAVTPSVLATRYNFPATQTAVSGNSMAVAEFQGQYYKPTDLTYFNTNCGTNVGVDTNIGTNGNSAGTRPPPPSTKHRTIVGTLLRSDVEGGGGVWSRSVQVSRPSSTLSTSSRSRPPRPSPTSTRRRTRSWRGGSRSPASRRRR
jgi:hypothetical protein